ncbi:MAG: hypothetical protein RIQ33_1834 [Bacteroidota bacterium]
MKYFIITAIICLGMVQKINAQGFYIGVQGGLNNVWVSNINPLWSRIDSLHPSAHKISSIKNTFRGGIGLQAGFEITKNFAIVTELNSQFQGYGYIDSTNSKGIINGNYSSNFIQIPLMIKLMAGRDGSGFFIMAGPNYAMLQSSTLTEKGKNWNETTVDLKAKNYVIHNEVGITSVLGIQFKAADHWLFTFGFRGNFGTKNFNNLKSTVANYTSPKSTNGSVGINLGIGYHF